MPFLKTVAPILLAGLSTIATSHSASAEESRIRIETDRTEARIEFCTTKEDCQFIHFSGIFPEQTISEETSQKPTKENRSNNLIKQINDQIFGLFGF